MKYILNMHPVVRFSISLFFSVLIFILLKYLKINFLFSLLISWFTFSTFFLVFSWIIIVKRKVEIIKKKAKKDDGSTFFVFFMVILSSFASIFLVFLLMISKEIMINNDVILIVSIIGMILSWFMLHSIYIFHYAHIYYDNRNKKIGGLDFPNDLNPDYLDFAYFSLVLGSTFQVSDVSITEKRIRRIALIHGILSFLLNSFVVALTINLIASLAK